MPKSATAYPPLYRMRPLETGDVSMVAGYLADALMAECGFHVLPSELEQLLNFASDSHAPRFWIVERRGIPTVIASGPNRDKGNEGFDYVVWLGPASPPLKEALLRFWLEKWPSTEPCSVATFCRAHGILPASVNMNPR